ncbi:MAG: BON domain-containing protein [Pseudomonadota bacterium]
MQNADTRRTPLTPAFRLATAAALALTLAACGESADNATLGQKLDSAISQTEQKADELGSRAENAMDEAQVKAEAATADARASVEAATERMAGAVDDATITANVSARLAGDPELSALKIDVDTQDGKVTLTGPAPSEAARGRAAELAATVEGVVGIDNRLQVVSG